MLGYHNLPEETAKRLRDGWYYTGDICRRDAEGFYYFVGRTDDMFVSGGENIFPGEVEALLRAPPGRASGAGNAVRARAERPGALRLRRAAARAAVTEDEIKQFALANGPAYQHPRRVFFLEQFPLAGTNKVDREELRRLVTAGR